MRVRHPRASLSLSRSDLTSPDVRQAPSLPPARNGGFRRGETSAFRSMNYDHPRPSPPPSRSARPTAAINSHTMEVTSLSHPSQVTFGKYSSNEILAIVRVPELSSDDSAHPRSSSTANSRVNIRHGISEPELYTRAKQEEDRSRLHYQRVSASSYRPPSISETYQQRQSRSRHGEYTAGIRHVVLVLTFDGRADSGLLSLRQSFVAPTLFVSFELSGTTNGARLSSVYSSSTIASLFSS